MSFGRRTPGDAICCSRGVEGASGGEEFAMFLLFISPGSITFVSSIHVVLLVLLKYKVLFNDCVWGTGELSLACHFRTTWISHLLSQKHHANAQGISLLSPSQAPSSPR